MKTDFELLDAWQGGDDAAGRELFGRHFESIFRFFHHKVDGDASDLVQRTFLACIEARERFRRDASFRTFLFGIARNELHGHWRKRKRDERIDFGITSAMDLDPSPSTLVAKRRESQLLLDALRALPIDYQIAIELYYWEGLSGSELATVLGVPEGTVRSRLRRAQEQLRKHMAESAGSGEHPAITDEALEGWASSLRDDLGAEAVPSGAPSA